MSKRQMSQKGNESSRASKAGKMKNVFGGNAGPRSGDRLDNEIVWAKIGIIQNQMLLLTKRVGKFEPTMGKVMEGLDKVNQTLQSSLNEDNLARIMKDVIQQVRMEKLENDNVQRKGQLKEVTQVRSNNNLHIDQANLQEQWKDGHAGGSECSVSPLIEKIKKGTKAGMIRKQTRWMPGPIVNRPLLFRGDEDEDTLIKNLKKVPANKGLRCAMPYSSISQISQDDARIVQYVFYKRARTEDDHDEMVCSCDGSFITRTNLQCLRPRGLVSSDVINTYVNYLNDGGPDWYLNTYLCGNACRGMAKHQSYEQWIQQTITLSNFWKFYGRIGNCDRIFVPMHEPTTAKRIGHWYLLVIHVKDRYLELIDSLAEEGKFLSRRRDAKTTLDMLDVLLGDDIRKLLESPCILSSLPWAYEEPTRQPNCTDCGIFVIRNMEDPTSKWAQQYDSQTERLRLLLKCVRHEKNEVTDIHVKIEQSLLRWKEGKGNSKVSKKKAAPVIVNLISEET